MKRLKKQKRHGTKGRGKMRKHLRQIAKARLRAIGVDRVNRRLAVVDNETGLSLWRKVLADDKAHNAQAKGRKAIMKARKTA